MARPRVARVNARPRTAVRSAPTSRARAIPPSRVPNNVLMNTVLSGTSTIWYDDGTGGIANPWDDIAIWSE